MSFPSIAANLGRFFLVVLLRLCRIGTNGITHSNRKRDGTEGKQQEETLCCHSISANNKQEEPGFGRLLFFSFFFFSPVFENDGMTTIPGRHCRVVQNDNYDDNTVQVRHAIATRKHSSSKRQQNDEKKKGKKKSRTWGVVFLLCLFFARSSLTLIDPSFFIRPPCLPLQCSGSMDFDIPR